MESQATTPVGPTATTRWDGDLRLAEAAAGSAHDVPTSGISVDGLPDVDWSAIDIAELDRLRRELSATVSESRPQNETPASHYRESISASRSVVVLRIRLLRDGGSLSCSRGTPNVCVSSTNTSARIGTRPPCSSHRTSALTDA